MARKSPVLDAILLLCKANGTLRRKDLIALCVSKGFHYDTSSRMVDVCRRSFVLGISPEEFLVRLRLQKKGWYHENKIELRQKALDYCRSNKEVVNDRTKAYLKTSEGIENRRKWKRARCNNPIFHSEDKIRAAATRVRIASGRKTKTRRTFEELGYSPKDYFEHMSATLPKGTPYNECQHDHIIPVSFLISVGIMSIAIINSLDNMQLLTKEQNNKKRDSVDLSLAKGVVLAALQEKGIC
jgi:hypothetical protein